jgi:hypothetical protein
MLRLRAFSAISVLAFLGATRLPGAEATYAGLTWPSVVELEQRGDEIVAKLGGRFSIDRMGDPPGGRYIESSVGAPRRALVRGRVGAWRPVELPPPKASVRIGRDTGDLAGLLDELYSCDAQAPGVKGELDVRRAVTRRNGYLWFGTEWYGGEGSWGTGGFGRRRDGSGPVEARWPAEVRRSSITAVEWDGRWLWAGTEYSGEYGAYPTQGLVRYEWGSGAFEEVTRAGYGPCGFLPTSILRVGDELWIGSELGLSIHREKDGTWSHFVPDLADARLMRPTTCEALYAEVLSGVGSGQSEWDRQNLSLSLRGALKTYRPSFSVPGESPSRKRQKAWSD